VQASLDQRQRFQQPFFPEGIAFDEIAVFETGVTAHRLSATCGKSGSQMKELVDQTGIEPVTS
jgi:hypothetical protein